MEDSKTLKFPEEESPETESAAADSVTEADGADIPLSITVEDGLRMVPIKNKMGQQIGVFDFRPTDFDIITRFNEMAQRWDEEVRKPLNALGDAPDVSDPEAEAALQKAKEKLFALCDYACGGNMSEAFFGSMNPFSPVDGGLYCENVLSAVSDFLAAQFNRETAKISGRVKKYLPADHLRKGGKKRLK